MKSNPEELLKLKSEIQVFLEAHNWIRTKEIRGLVIYEPPNSLNFEGKFSIALPEDSTKPSAHNLLLSAANAIENIYGIVNSKGVFENAAGVLSNQLLPSQITARFVDDSTQKGAMPLGSLAAYTQSLEQGLYRSAKFKLGEETNHAKLIAQQFVENCMFLQTAEGSFVTRVEIPHFVLKQKDLFGNEELVSSEISSSVFSSIRFLNERILGDDEPFETPEILENAITLFDVDLLESLTKMVIEPKMESIEFSIQMGNQITSSSTGWINEDRKTRLKGFLDFVREQLLCEDELVVVGTIVELRSRDPQGNKNYIKVVTEFHGDRTFITAPLNNEQYQEALDAHRNKRSVQLIGKGIRLKTQIRFVELQTFNTI